MRSIFNLSVVSDYVCRELADGGPVVKHKQVLCCHETNSPTQADSLQAVGCLNWLCNHNKRLLKTIGQRKRCEGQARARHSAGFRLKFCRGRCKVGASRTPSSRVGHPATLSSFLTNGMPYSLRVMWTVASRIC
jgi:hypothetical protein